MANGDLFHITKTVVSVVSIGDDRVSISPIKLSYLLEICWVCIVRISPVGYMALIYRDVWIPIVE